MEFLGLDGRELAGDVWKGVEGDWRRFFLCGPDAFARLGNVYFKGLHQRREIICGIRKGEARP